MWTPTSSDQNDWIQLRDGVLNIRAEAFARSFDTDQRNIIEYFLSLRPSKIELICKDGEPLVELGVISWLADRCDIHNLTRSIVHIRAEGGDDRISQWFDFKAEPLHKAWSLSGFLPDPPALVDQPKTWGFQLARFTLPRLILAYRIAMCWPDDSEIICRFDPERVDSVRNFTPETKAAADWFFSNREHWLKQNLSAEDLQGHPTVRADVALRKYPELARLYRIEIDCESQLNNPYFFTEKTSKAVRMTKPFFFFGSCNALMRWRKMGYLSFHPHFDESYDHESGLFQRMERMLDSMHELYNSPDFEQRIELCEQIQMKNLRRLKVMHDLWPRS